MAADPTLVSAFFKQGATRKTGDSWVIDQSPLYKANMDQMKMFQKLITGTISEMRLEEKERKKKKNKQTELFQTKLSQARKKIIDQKESLPTKVHDAIFNHLKKLQDEFELVNTIGKNDTTENERERSRLEAELAKVINQAIDTRATIGKIAQSQKDLNLNSINEKNIAIGTQFFDFDNIDENDNVSVSIQNGKLTFNHAGGYMVDYVEVPNPDKESVLKTLTEEVRSGDPVSWTMEDFENAFPAIDKEFDIYNVKRHNDLKAQAKSDGDKYLFDEDEETAEVLARLTTKKEFQNVANRGVGASKISFRDELLDSGLIQTESILGLMKTVGGIEENIGAALAQLDLDGDGDIDNEDAKLTEQKKYNKDVWKQQANELLDVLTDVDHESFDLELSAGLFAKSVVGKYKETYDRHNGAKKIKPGKKGFTFKDNMHVTFTLPDGSTESKLGRSANVVLFKLSNPNEGSSITGWDGNNYAYKEGDWYDVNNNIKISRNQIAINLGLPEYGFNFPLNEKELAYNEQVVLPGEGGSEEEEKKGLFGLGFLGL
jgi:hypothetical protein